MLKNSLLIFFLGLTLVSGVTAQDEPQTESQAESEPTVESEASPELDTEAPPLGQTIVVGGSEHHLRVEISGADPATGTVEISLFKNNEFYLSKPFLQSSGPVREDGTFRALFNKLDAGEYAVVVVHDANDNQKLDTGFLGLGGEAYAYSTNYKPWFGRPGFEDIAITVEGSTQIEIHLQ